MGKVSHFVCAPFLGSVTLYTRAHSPYQRYAKNISRGHIRCLWGVTEGATEGMNSASEEGTNGAWWGGHGWCWREPEGAEEGTEDA